MKSSATKAIANEPRGRPRRESLPWQERENLDLQLAREVSGVSEGTLYKAANEGRLTLIKLGGRTLVKTTSLREYMKTNKAWTASDRGAAARAKRAENARANWRS